MDTRVKKLLTALIVTVLMLPLVQQLLGVVTSAPLRGYFALAQDTVFTVPGWLSGSYQLKKERYLNDATGFRPDLVRLNNQIDFSMFGKCHAGWDVRGHDNMLFQWPYIEAYYGNEYVGYDTIAEKTRKLKALHDTLSHLGKSLIIVYAPSKASSYPELFPDDRVQQLRNISNKDAYKQRCDSLGLHQVDMDAWFVSLKHTSKEPVFAKQGTHFTIYGGTLVSDSLMRYVERLRHIRMLHPDWSKMEYMDHARYESGDDDIGSEINLMFPVAHERFAYPVIIDRPDSTATRPNLIFIGDSYAHKLMACDFISRVTKQYDIWVYMRDAIQVNAHTSFPIPPYDWRPDLAKADCIILFYTSFNIKELGNGFIEHAYSYYFPTGAPAL